MTVEDLQKYEYTERAIKESMRLFPLGPILARMSSEDVTFGMSLEVMATPIID